MGPMQFTNIEKQQALKIASDAIAYGVTHHQKIAINSKDYDIALQQKACCFVSLYKAGRLRGCVGALDAYQSLAEDVAEHAYASAFNDQRFSPLQHSELAELSIEISVLTPKQKISCSSEQDLIDELQPNVDGLLIKDGSYQATFLPVVWRSLPDKKEFLLQLKRKAGMPDTYWSETLQAFRYGSVTISDESKKGF